VIRHCWVHATTISNLGGGGGGRGVLWMLLLLRMQPRKRLVANKDKLL
jgi:hypothetical protein